MLIRLCDQTLFPWLIWVILIFSIQHHLNIIKPHFSWRWLHIQNIWIQWFLRTLLLKLHRFLLLILLVQHVGMNNIIWTLLHHSCISHITLTLIPSSTISTTAPTHSRSELPSKCLPSKCDLTTHVTALHTPFLDLSIELVKQRPNMPCSSVAHLFHRCSPYHLHIRNLGNIIQFHSWLIALAYPPIKPKTLGIWGFLGWSDWGSLYFNIGLVHFHLDALPGVCITQKGTEFDLRIRLNQAELPWDLEISVWLCSGEFLGRRVSCFGALPNNWILKPVYLAVELFIQTDLCLHPCSWVFSTNWSSTGFLRVLNNLRFPRTPVFWGWVESNILGTCRVCTALTSLPNPQMLI